MDNAAAAPNEHVVVYYDGDCALCAASVRWLLRAGIPSTTFFASQQGHHWAALLLEHPELEAIDSLVVTHERDGTTELLVRSDALLWLCAHLPAPYRYAGPLRSIPRFLRDLGYRALAVSRRMIPAPRPQSTCPIPSAELQARLLD